MHYLLLMHLYIEIISPVASAILAAACIPPGSSILREA